MKTHSMFRKRAIASAMAATMVFGAVAPFGVVRAYSLPTIDLTQILNSLYEYKNEYDRYKKILTTLENLQYQLSLGQDTYLKQVGENEGVAQACPGAPLLSPTGMLRAAGLTSGSVLDQQLKICAEIKRTQNKKFNETVKVLEKMQTQTADQIRQLQSHAKAAGDNSGNQSVAQTSIQQFSVQMNAIDQNYQRQMSAYDQYIIYLNGLQTQLGRRAMRGSTAGKVIQAGTLARELKK